MDQPGCLAAGGRSAEALDRRIGDTVVTASRHRHRTALVAGPAAITFAAVAIDFAAVHAPASLAGLRRAVGACAGFVVAQAALSGAAGMTGIAGAIAAAQREEAHAGRSIGTACRVAALDRAVPLGRSQVAERVGNRDVAVEVGLAGIANLPRAACAKQGGPCQKTNGKQARQRTQNTTVHRRRTIRGRFRQDNGDNRTAIPCRSHGRWAPEQAVRPSFAPASNCSASGQRRAVHKTSGRQSRWPGFL